MLHACAISSDGKHVATGDKVGHIVVWDIAIWRARHATLEAPVALHLGPHPAPPLDRRDSRARLLARRQPRWRSGGIGQIGNIDHLEGPPRVEVFDWRKTQKTHEFSGEGSKGMVERLDLPPRRRAYDLPRRGQ